MANKKLIIKGIVKSELTDAQLDQLTIELFDQNQLVGAAITRSKIDAKGIFKFELNPQRIKRLFKGKMPEVFLAINKDNRPLFSTMDQQVLALDKDIGNIEINLPKDVAETLVLVKEELPKLAIRNLLKISGVSQREFPDIESKLKRAGLLKLESILGKPKRLTTGRTGLNEKTLNKFKALTRFAAISGSEELSQKLFDNGFQSLHQVGAISLKALSNRLGKLNKGEREQLNILYRSASNVRNDVLNQAAYSARLKSKDSLWHNPTKTKDQNTKPANPCGCTDCNNVFSPRAYLICLLDMVHDHWRLAVYNLEKILLQEIDDLDCDGSLVCYLQIELAIEILEKSGRIRLPLNDTKLAEDVENIWINFFFGKADTDQQIKKYQDLFKDMQQNGSNRLKDLLNLLTNPGLGLQSIRKGIEKSKSNPKITDLKDKSAIYAKGGEAFDTALDETYQQILGLYRDALIKNSHLTAEQLQNELFIDLKASTCHKTNRLTFLILAIQAFVLAVRTGQLKDFSRPDIDNNYRNNVIRKLYEIPVEEASWKWLKDYSSWASAMYVFLFPENACMPFLWRELGEKYTGDDDFSDYTNQFLSRNLNRLGVFKLIYEYWFDHASRKYIREDNEHINPDLYPIFLKTVIEPGEGTFGAASVAVDKFMYNLRSLIESYQGEKLFGHDIGHAVIPNDKLTEKDLKNNLYFQLLAAFTLNKSENYASAHDWYRQLYDPTKSGNDRFVFDFNHHFNDSVVLGEDWDNGLLDPDSIVHRRQGAMLRHVILMMVKNILDWADHEYSLATASSLDRARQLYELANEVLDSPDLANPCDQSINELMIEIISRYGINNAKENGTDIEKELDKLDDPEKLKQVINGIRGVLPEPDGPDPLPIQEIEKIIKDAVINNQSPASTTTISEQLVTRQQELEQAEDEILTISAATNHGSNVSPVFFRNAGGTYRGMQAIYYEPNDKAFVNPVTFCVPPNPLLLAFNLYIETALLKLQLCLDITGEPLPEVTLNDESQAEFFDTIDTQVERQPLLDLPANWFNQPPRYRYSYLIEKVRQYTDAAQRMGNSLLTAYEKFDNENLAILRAQHAIEIASSMVDLRNLGLKDAVKGRELADLQLDRANEQQVFWQGRIDAGMLSTSEWIGIGLMLTSGALSTAAGAIQGVGAITAFFSAGFAGTAGGAAAGTVVEPGGGTGVGGGGGSAAGFALGSAVGAAVPGTVGALGSFASAASTFASANLTFAGFKRRWEDWNLQLSLSDFDSRIAEVQKQSALNRIDIADKELAISSMQHTQSKEILTFLEEKFSNTHLYHWMIQILLQNYRTLMQISANVARQAQQALEFERQQKLDIINGDYWSVESALTNSSNLSDDQKDSGLLGAERLLTDLTRLDAYKLSSDQRRLQISKSISMAQMLPTEFVELRQSGRVTFNTLMHWFDRDFPGHYMRLIKSVKISMLALTPPTDGIHATLSNNGESSVVVKDGLKFKSIRSFRDFGEKIALDSPFNETGLFVFDYNDPMFLPFEGLGVETQWSLELPKASNRFNFDTLVDVMFTIEYTALHSDIHATNVRKALGDTDTNDIPIKPRLQFPDEWYHFKNDPVQADGTRSLNIQMPAHFLPSHYEKDQAISTIHITVMLIGNLDGLSANRRKQVLESIQIEHVYDENNGHKTLTLTSEVSPPVGETKFKTKLIQSQNSQYTLFSTRDNNDPSSRLDTGIDPIGDWNISVKDILMPDNVTLTEMLDDLLIIVTTEGQVNWE